MFERIPEPWLDPPVDDRKAVYACACCGEEILEGDEYFDFSFLADGLGVVCKCCVSEAHCYEASLNV